VIILNNDQEKVCIITGASSGIGKATALLLAQHKFIVILISRNSYELNSICNDINSSGGIASYFSVDLADSNSVENFVHTISKSYKKIDVLINNAGDMQPSPIESAKFSDWENMVTVNLLSVAKLTKLLLPLLIFEGGGNIINILSTAAYEAHENFSIYSATKHALRAFSESLRKEVQASNIRVTCLSPSTVDTHLISKINDTSMKLKSQEYIKNIEPLHTNDIAESIIYIINLEDRVQINEVVIRPMPRKRTYQS